LGRTRTGFLGSRGPIAQAGPVAGAAIRGRWWASASSPAPAPGRRPRTKDPSTAVPELCCQNLTAPLAVRRPWASRAGGSLTLAHGKSAAPVAFRGDQGGGNSPGLLLPEVLPGPPSPPRRSRAAGGCQPLVCPWWPPHCRNAIVPWPTEDQGPIHAAVGVPLSKFDSPSPPGDPGPAHGGTTCIVFPSSQRPLSPRSPSAMRAIAGRKRS